MLFKVETRAPDDQTYHLWNYESATISTISIVKTKRDLFSLFPRSLIQIEFLRPERERDLRNWAGVLLQFFCSSRGENYEKVEGVGSSQDRKSLDVGWNRVRVPVYRPLGLHANT